MHPGVVRAGSSLVTNTTPGKFKFEAEPRVLRLAVAGSLAATMGQGVVPACFPVGMRNTSGTVARSTSPKVMKVMRNPVAALPLA